MRSAWSTTTEENIMYSHVILVNNTGSDIRDFESYIIDAIRNNTALPDEISDLFNLAIIEVNGKVRGILTAA